MLELKKIGKSYKTGNFVQHALKNVSIAFRKNEFVSILGHSGSGKTTLLNIIGGLDRYDKGDLIINDISTKKFTDKDWDAYRNNCVGFIFQSYNLIGHISVLENVEMSLTLSGVSTKERRKKALDALSRVGLKDHAHKKPNELSGGQMQRVAIARSLVNDPDIILADEPTGALDTKTSKQIMELIKEIAKDKLVIMVTHNPELAYEYSTRIVELSDGEIISDSNPIQEEKNSEEIKIKRTAMSFLTALKLSFNNIKTKKGRTAITAFASSIGIIGIALILALSNGFNIEVSNFEKDSLSQAPIIISSQAMSIDSDTFSMLYDNDDYEEYPDTNKIYVQEDIQKSIQHINKITDEYVNYINDIDKKYISGIAMTRSTNLNIIGHNNDGYFIVNTTNMGINDWTLLPSNGDSENDVVTSNYDVIAGEINNDEPGLILQVNNKNQIYASTLKQLGFSDEEEVSFEDIMNKELKVILNDEYYSQIGEYFVPRDDLENLYNSENAITLKVKAIIRGKEGKEVITSGSGFAYTNALINAVIAKNKNSNIVKLQNEKNYNILTNSPFDESEGSLNTKEMMLGYLGADTVPVAISIYPKDFNSKDKVLTYLDDYNEGKNESDIIQYTDMAEMISSLSGNIMDAITIVLVAFSSISLVVSSIMIGIITYISVLERTKEIGILRALGARKKDIRRVFNAETILIGIFSGVLGIVIAYILVIPTNIIIENLSGLAGVAKLNPIHALILIMISMILTVIGGAIPANMASKKDPVIALRTE